MIKGYFCYLAHMCPDQTKYSGSWLLGLGLAHPESQYILFCLNIDVIWTFRRPQVPVADLGWAWRTSGYRTLQMFWRWKCSAPSTAPWDSCCCWEPRHCCCWSDCRTSRKQFCCRPQVSLGISGVHSKHASIFHIWTALQTHFMTFIQ